MLGVLLFVFGPLVLLLLLSAWAAVKWDGAWKVAAIAPAIFGCAAAIWLFTPHQRPATAGEPLSEIMTPLLSVVALAVLGMFALVRWASRRPGRGGQIPA